MRLAARGSKLKLFHTALTPSTNQPAFYVFGSERPDGFVIASADDRLQPVLGIADSGSFSNLPENMQWWLGQYENEIQAYYDANGSEASSLTSVYDNYATWAPLQPICKTQWNQLDPYNLLCPTVNGSRSVTGCVATCLAQAIKAIGYFKGSGKREYTTNGATVSFDYDNYKPDFSKMRDKYDGGATQEEKNEVAKLMLACGVSVGTAYNSVSGALFNLGTIRQYMGFDNETFTVHRNGMTSPEWETLCYEIIKAGKPLCYAGSGSGGHAFICDGYSEDGFFHFNWGWGGTADGYFRLSSLNPRHIGTGGFAGGYTMEQNITVLMTPDDEKLELSTFHPGVVKWEDRNGIAAPSRSGDSYTFGNFMYLLTSEAYGNPMEVGMGLVLENRDGVSEDVYIEPTGYVMCQHNAAKTGFTVKIPVDKLPAGAQYDAYPVYSFRGWDGYWKLSPWEPTNLKDHFLAKVNSKGRVTFSVAAMDAPKLAISGMEVNEFYANDNNNTFKCVLTNYSKYDYTEKVDLRLYKEDGKTKVKDIASSYMLLGSGETMTLDANIPTSGIAAGKYQLWLYRSGYNIPLNDEAKIDVEIKSGKRPEPEKGAGPTGTYEVSFWVNGARQPMAPASMIAGREFSGVTSVIAANSQSVDYSLAFFKHGETTNPIAKYPIAKYDLKGSGIWVEGTAFSIKPDLKIGAYTMAFVDRDNKLLSYPADFCVGTVKDGILYDYDLAAGGLAVSGADDAVPSKVTIPAEVESYPVVGVAEGAFDLCCASLEELTLPASVKSIGLNAFRNAKALRYVWFGSTEAPFVTSAFAFNCVNPAVEFYVPDAGFEAYAPAFRYRGRLFAEISELKLPAAVEAQMESDLEITDVVTPAANFNPNIAVEVANPGVLSAVMNGPTLVITPIAEGETTVKLTSAQPGVAPVQVAVKVAAKPEDSSIAEIGAETPVEYFDLTGRRVASPRGIVIMRQNGKSTVVRR